MAKTKNLYLDIHALQTVPPSCVNRDDTGSPKTAVYGGVTRARISSQSWKRAMRLWFRQRLAKDKLAVRTRKIVSLIASEIDKIADVDDSEKAAKSVLTAAGLSIKSTEKGTDALFFISNAQAKALAALVNTNPDILNKTASKETKDLAKRSLQMNPGIEVALFGRMVADDPSLNTDATSQVAHAISTHQVITEYDYFTAVDDLAPEDNVGAAHLGTVEFNSSTLYRYATVAVHNLYPQLGNETIDSVMYFVEAFVKSMPTGKQNTFANRTLPTALLVTLRDDQPVNLVGAFERPINTSAAVGQGYADASADAFVRYVEKTYQDWLNKPLASFVTGAQFSQLTDPTSFQELLSALKDNLAEIYCDGEED